MSKLIKAEFLKLSKSMGYKILLLCALGTSVLTGLFMMDTEYGVANGYSAYLSGLTDTSVIMVFASIFASIFVCNEYSNRTFGMSLFSGCSRQKVLLAKSIVFLIGLMPIVFTEPLLAGIMVSATKGFGDLTVGAGAKLIQATLLYALMSAAIGCFCIMLAVLIKNIGGTIGTAFGLMMGMELMGLFPGMADLAKYTFSYQMSLLPQLESPTIFIAVAVSTLVVTLGASVIIFQKTELK